MFVYASGDANLGTKDFAAEQHYCNFLVAVREAVLIIEVQSQQIPDSYDHP